MWMNMLLGMLSSGTIHKDDYAFVVFCGEKMKPEKELINLLESIMDFERWGFNQSYIHISHKIFPELIYDSEWCRVKFSFEHSGERYPYPDTRLKVRYSRLHAPDDDFFMTINGQKYWCWHGTDLILRFLDNMTPTEAAQEWDNYLRWPPMVRQFIKSDFAQKLSHPEWEIRIESTIWDHYGQRLFEVFDLRELALWARYVKFTKEFHKLINSESHFGYPPQDRIY